MKQKRIYFKQEYPQGTRVFSVIADFRYRVPSGQIISRKEFKRLKAEAEKQKK